MNIKQSYSSFKILLSKNRVVKRCVYVFLFFMAIALFAPFIANDKPLVCKYKGQWLFPAFSFKHQMQINDETINYNMGKDWKTLNTDFILFALIVNSKSSPVSILETIFG